MTNNDIITQVLESEGWPKFSNDPNDRGGPTKGGITLKTLEEWRHNTTSIDDLECLSEDEARRLYEQLYIELPQFDKIIDDNLRSQVVDAGVLHGVSTSLKLLQKAAIVEVDGVFGPITIYTVNSMNGHALRRAFLIERILFISRIVTNNLSQARYLTGWLSRALKYLD